MRFRSSVTGLYLAVGGCGRTSRSLTRGSTPRRHFPKRITNDSPAAIILRGAHHNMCFLAPSAPHTQEQSFFLGREQLENGVYRNQGQSFGGHTPVLTRRCLWLKGAPLIFPSLMCALLPARPCICVELRPRMQSGGSGGGVAF